MQAYESDDIERGGMTFRFEKFHDEDMGAPWREHDGHGIVTEWTTRTKKPGERILADDRGSRRYYDIAGTIEVALKDGWGIAPEKSEGMTKRQIAAAAVELDFERMKDWCNDQWHWTWVCATLLDTEGRRTHETASLAGIESDADDDYFAEVFGELADEIAGRIPESGQVCVSVRKARDEDAV